MLQQLLERCAFGVAIIGRNESCDTEHLDQVRFIGYDLQDDQTFTCTLT